ncbi:unnamed protein product, partial [Ectocarpus sp. 12 AP-2014]
GSSRVRDLTPLAACRCRHDRFPYGTAKPVSVRVDGRFLLARFLFWCSSHGVCCAAFFARLPRLNKKTKINKKKELTPLAGLTVSLCCKHVVLCALGGTRTADVERAFMLACGFCNFCVKKAEGFTRAHSLRFAPCLPPYHSSYGNLLSLCLLSAPWCMV